MGPTMSPVSVSSAHMRLAQEERRRRILESAVALFEHQGFQGTTTDEIAAAAGITKRTLYRYIGNKDALLFEIHANFVQEGLTRWQAAAAEGGTAIEVLRRLIRVHMNVVANHQAAIRVHVEEWKHLSEDDRARIVDQRDTYEGILRDALRRGMSSGELRTQDLRVTTLCVLSTLTDVYRWFRRGPGLLPPDELADFIANFLLSGLEQ
jgi:AcrR family transcriptional regulator